MSKTKLMVRGKFLFWFVFRQSNIAGKIKSVQASTLLQVSVSTLSDVCPSVKPTRVTIKESKSFCFDSRDGVRSLGKLRSLCK